ncbi:retrovirus-related pol polyprotein from transposon TNT 1-94 [Tanacetum coccineum]
MQEEINSIEKNGTWKLVNLPEGKKAIGLKWIFKTKLHLDGTIQRHKARLVARGYVQEQGIDFKETFSPVGRFEPVRIILALATMMRWMVFQFDVKSAFLNGELKEEAPRAWYSKIDEFFHLNGFERSSNEPTLYVKREGAEDIVFVSLYVDDMIHTSSSIQLILRFKEAMMN